MRNNWTQDGNTIAIQITRRNGDRYTALIDAADYDVVKPHTWHVIPDSRRIYCATAISDGYSKQKHVLLHRLLLDGEIPEDHEVTFADGNPLNCQRSNLLTAPHIEIAQGKASPEDTHSGQRNVFLHQAKPYVSLIVRGRQFLRSCDSVDEAIHWRDAKLAELGFKIKGARRVAL